MLGLALLLFPLALSLRLPSDILRKDMATGLPTFLHPNGAEYAQTPAGFVLSKCVHVDLPSGSVIEPQADGSYHVRDRRSNLQRIVPPCPWSSKQPARVVVDFVPREEIAKPSGALPPYYDGWQTFTQFEHQPSISSFLGTFSTPDVPQNTPMVDFLFTGLQNIPWIPLVDPEPDHLNTPFDIIQPVIQYPANGGSYWSVRSWIVSLGGIGGQTFASTEVPLQPGDWVFGNMTQTAQDAWDVISVRTASGAATTLHTKGNARLTNQPYAYVTLETYGASDCSFFPKVPSAFVNMSMTNQGQIVVPKWDAVMSPSKYLKCSSVHCQVQSPSKVQVIFD